MEGSWEAGQAKGTLWVESWKLGKPWCEERGSILYTQRTRTEPDDGNCSPREALSTKLQAGFIANQDSLGFWTRMGNQP